MLELGTFEEQQATTTAVNPNGFRESLWKDGTRKANGNAATDFEIFLVERNETFYTGRHQRENDQRDIILDRAYNTRRRPSYQKHARKMGPCFNCDSFGCSLRTCKKPKDIERIKSNHSKWKLQREIPVTKNTFYIDQGVSSSSNDKEAVDISMAVNIVNQDNQ